MSPSSNAIFFGVAATSARQAWAVGTFAPAEQPLGSHQALERSWLEAGLGVRLSGRGTLFAAVATPGRSPKSRG